VPWIGFPRDIIPFPAMETSKPYGNLLCDIALMNWYQGYSWHSEILQIRICLQVAEEPFHVKVNPPPQKSN